MRLLLDRIDTICAIPFWVAGTTSLIATADRWLNFIPASSFYHVLCAIAEAARVSPGPAFCSAIKIFAAQNGVRKTTGTVQSFSQLKRYGFIQSDADGKDVFVHLSAVRQAGLAGLRKGQNYLLKSTQSRQGGWREFGAESRKQGRLGTGSDTDAECDGRDRESVLKFTIAKKEHPETHADTARGSGASSRGEDQSK
jgi:cold shock protein